MCHSHTLYLSENTKIFKLVKTERFDRIPRKASVKATIMSKMIPANLTRNPRSSSGAGAIEPVCEVHLDERSLAARLGVSVKWLQKMRYTGGGIPYRKFGRAVRYPLSAVIAYEAQSLRLSTSDDGNSNPIGEARHA